MVFELLTFMLMTGSKWFSAHLKGASPVLYLPLLQVLHARIKSLRSKQPGKNAIIFFVVGNWRRHAQALDYEYVSYSLPLTNLLYKVSKPLGPSCSFVASYTGDVSGLFVREKPLADDYLPTLKLKLGLGDFLKSFGSLSLSNTDCKTPFGLFGPF